MNIEKILEALDKLDDNVEIRDVSREFTSYRGYYEHLAMVPSVGRRMSVAEFYNVLASQIGETYYGYKGGEFTMQGGTELFIAFYGRTGKLVSGVAVDEEGAYLTVSERDFNGL